MRRSSFVDTRLGRLPLRLAIILAVTALLGPGLLASAQVEENATFHGDVARTGEQPGPPPKGQGALLWRFQTEGAVRTSPILAGGLVYFGSNDGRLYAIDAQNGEPRWSFAATGAIRSTPTIADGLVVFGSDDGYVYCVSAENGELQWRFLVGRSEISASQTAADFLAWRTVGSSPLVIEGTVYVGGNDFTMHAIDLSTGIERWNQTFRSPTISSPSYKDGVIFAGTEAGVHAVDALTGHVVWEAIWGLPSEDEQEEEDDEQQDDDQDGTPNGEDTDDDNDGILDDQDLDSDAGEEDEEEPTLDEALLDGTLTVSEYLEVLGGLTWNVSASPVVVGNLVYAAGLAETLEKLDNGEPAASGGLLLQLDILTGAITGIWWFPTLDPVTTTPAVVDETIYLGSDRGLIYAVDATILTPDLIGSNESQDASEATTFAANQQRWGVQTEKYVLASPAVVGETVYTGNAAGTLYALDTKTGRERWTFQTGGPIWSSPTIAGGIVYVGSDDGYLYAIGGSS